MANGITWARACRVNIAGLHGGVVLVGVPVRVIPRHHRWGNKYMLHHGYARDTPPPRHMLAKARQILPCLGYRYD